MVSTQSPYQIYHFCYLFFNKNDIFNFWRWSSYYERYSLSRTSNFFISFSTSISLSLFLFLLSVMYIHLRSTSTWTSEFIG